jgi:hypothetical protein
MGDPLELKGPSSAKVLADAAAESVSQLAAIQVSHGGSWLLSLVIEPQQLRLLNQVSSIGRASNQAAYYVTNPQANSPAMLKASFQPTL